MLAIPDLLLYLSALAVAYLLPGPDMAMILALTMKHGNRHGLLAALGLALSRAIHVTLSGLGLAALFATHPLLFDGVRLLGAAYLLWLAWQIGNSPQLLAVPETQTTQPTRHALRQGLLTNLLNPKALMFCALFLPQFITPAHGALGWQYLWLGVILVVTGFVFDLLYVFGANRLARHMQVRKISSRLPQWGFAVVFVLAAGRLMVH